MDIGEYIAYKNYLYYRQQKRRKIAKIILFSFLLGLIISLLYFLI